MYTGSADGPLLTLSVQELHLTLHRAYSWFFAQWITLVVLGRSYVLPRIGPGSATYKAIALTFLLSLAQDIFLK